MSYVKGLTSSLQTQLNGKQSTLTLGTGVLTALGVNIGSAGAFTTFNGALGTPSSATLTNATGLPIVGGTTGTLSLARGGTGLTTVASGSILATNSLDTLTAITSTSGTKVLTNTSGTISWETASGGSSFTWTEVTGTSQSASVNSGYISNNAGLVTITIPTTCAVGDTVKVTGKGAGGWRIAQNASEQIHFGNLSTTSGTGGYLEFTHRRDTVELVCITADTEWNVVNSVGNITVN